MTFKLPTGGYGFISEGLNHKYTGMTLQSTATNTFRARFLDKQMREEDPSKPNIPPGYLPDDKWRVQGNVATPWRITMAVDNLNQLVNSDIVRNSSKPRSTVVQDWSFVKPGKALWSWWAHPNGDVSSNPQRQYEYVDAAAQMGFEYVLVDEGWRSWSDRDNKVKALTAYAAAKGVGIWLWDFYASSDNGTINYECWPWGNATTREKYYQYIKGLGAVGVKLDFMDNESQASLNWYEGNLRDAARYGLMVNFHGANKPTGEDRWYPNEMTREGVRGLEHNRPTSAGGSGGGGNPVHNTILPFTRGVAGSMDFTPATLNPANLGSTSYSFQLASALMFTSAVTHFVDEPKYYLYKDGNSALGENPALKVIKDMPTVFDETLVLDGSAIGELAAFARKKDGDWFIGIMNATGNRTLNVSLNFLTEVAYRATLLQDSSTTNAAFVKDVLAVNSSFTLPVYLRASGGFVAEFEPLAQGDGDMDDDVDASDVAKWALNFTGELSSGPTATKTWYQGDWDFDGDVDASDVAKWALNFTGELSGNSLIVNAPGALPEAVAILQSMGITVVPEPAATGAIGAFLALGALRRRR